MGITDVEHAKRRLQDILRKAQKLEVPANDVLATKAAQKLLTRSRNVFVWSILIGVFILVLFGVVYARWPTQEVETIRTVLRRSCGSGDIADRVAALMHSSSTQDDC